MTFVADGHHHTLISGSSIMRTSIRRTLCATAIAGGFTVLGIAFTTTAAEAADQPNTTSGASALVSGNQTGVDADAPVNAGGNQITVIGDGNRNDSDSGSPAGSDTASDSSSGASTSGEQGTGSGNQTDVDADAPVSGSGNQVTVIGDGNDNSASTGSGAGTGSAGSGSDTTSGADGTGSGNQTGLDAIVPVDASGNQVTVIGNGNENGSKNTGAATGTSPSGGNTTTGEDGAASGNQTGLAAVAPIDATGNQITVIGDGNNAATTNGSGTGSEAATGTTGGNTTDGTDGTGSGNQTGLAAVAPIDATGNQITVIGDGNESTTDTTGPATGTGPEGDTTSGEEGAGSGNQTDPSVAAPVDLSDNQVTIIGSDNETPGAIPNTGETEGPAESVDGTDETDATDGVVTTPVSGTPGAGNGSGNDSTPASSDTAVNQAGPLAPVAGVLPKTGSPAGLLFGGLAGLLMLLLGLGLVAGRREGLGGRLRGQGVAQAL
jgi:hypothetical protein